ncbi:protein FRA10AC1 homolog [Stomoxys calcitrans]|uniref:protein FRA10AC1 homolog n=1 Tax=Stomoxys calcitrans TaxID=35570 RepID=UPI0027E26961|nr:protein FRA10AC1 homolog [Stomoxys calcitrans]
MFPIPLKSLSDQERHDYILKTFILNNQSLSERRKHKRDIDVIREHHRFLWDDSDDANEDSWEVRLAKRYYDKLFKEYCIADLTRYKENKIALRWRTEAEVVAGIGQFQCGSRKCLEKENLRSWEVNFAYKEQNEHKNALIKLRLCPEHSQHLNYSSKKREIKRMKHIERKMLKDEMRMHKKASKSKNYPKADVNEYNNDFDSSSTTPKPIKEVSTNNGESDSGENTECKNRLEVSEEIWNKKPDIDTEPYSRECEFERYLEDLLL